MKENILKIAQTIQSGKVPEDFLFSSIMGELVALKDECLKNNSFSKYPEAQEYFELQQSLSSISLFKNKYSLPYIWGDFISSAEKRIDYLALHNEEVDKQELLKDISKIDGFQEYNKQKTIKKETSLVGLGSFDAMFVSMDNDKIKKENEKEKDFSISSFGNKHYVRFKAAEIKEESFLDLDNSVFFSSSEQLDYVKFNYIIALNGDVYQIHASLNTTFNKTQVHLYCLDKDGNIKETEGYSIAQYINYLEESAFCKLIDFKEDYISDFNSKIYSYSDKCFTFKGITSILKPKYSVDFFKEYNTKGFEFPFFVDYDKHANIRHNKLKEDMDFQMKKQGRKEYGDKANELSTSLRQSNVFLLEEFTNLEKERLLLNIKPKLNIPDFDKINFSNQLCLDKLFQGNLYKMQAMDAINVYTSNISPAFGRAIINSGKFFQIAERDVEVSDFERYKVKAIQPEESVQVEEFPVIDLSDYSFSIHEVETIDDKSQKQSLLGLFYLEKKSNENVAYRNIHLPKDIFEILVKYFNLTDLCSEEFLFDRRRTYKNHLESTLINFGATKVDYNEEKISQSETSINDLAAFIEDVDLTVDDDIEEKEIKALFVRFTDKRYYDIVKDFEDFKNFAVVDIVNNVLTESEASEVFEHVSQDEEKPNAATFIYKTEKEEAVKAIFSKFEQRKFPKTNDVKEEEQL